MVTLLVQEVYLWSLNVQSFKSDLSSFKIYMVWKQNFSLPEINGENHWDKI